MRRGSVLPLIVVAGLLIAGTFYLFTSLVHTKPQLVPSPAPTASPDPYPGWKSYQNEKFNFSLRYPGDWEVKNYNNLSADFFAIDPGSKQSTSGAALVRFLSSSEKADTKEFEKIQKLSDGSQFAEILDVRSLITKIKGFEIGNNQAIDYIVERAFSALEGPRGEYSHVISIQSNVAVLKFISHSTTREQHERFNEPIFPKVISSIKFN